jgi:hypothetical protein
MVINDSATLLQLKLLLFIQPEDVARYRQHFAAHSGVEDAYVHTVPALQLALHQQTPDVLVIDNRFERAYRLVPILQQQQPRLIVVLVDEQVDFAMPGYADDISTSPLVNDDLMRRIRQLIAERQMETARASAMPLVRSITRRMRAVSGAPAKQRVIVEAVRELVGYDYTACYNVTQLKPPLLALAAHDGQSDALQFAPETNQPDDLLTRVLETGHAYYASIGQTPTHPLVAMRRFGAVACVPCVYNGLIYGVLVVMRNQERSIDDDHLRTLELVTTQYAAQVAREVQY